MFFFFWLATRACVEQGGELYVLQVKWAVIYIASEWCSGNFFPNQTTLTWYFFFAPPLFPFPYIPKGNCCIRSKRPTYSPFVKCSPCHKNKVLAWPNDIHQDTSPLSRCLYFQWTRGRRRLHQRTIWTNYITAPAPWPDYNRPQMNAIYFMVWQQNRNGPHPWARGNRGM